MKNIFFKIITVFIIMITTFQSTYADSFGNVGVNFDWLYLSKEEKESRVTDVFNKMFPKGYVTNFPRGMLKTKLKNYLKDKDYKIHYDAVCAGYKLYNGISLEPFYLGKSDNVYMYAAKFNNEPLKTFYYDALGRLRFVDFTYGGYPQYPFYIKKYAINGKLIRAMYMKDEDTMYIYSNKGAFIGVKFKDTVYGFNFTK